MKKTQDISQIFRQMRVPASSKLDERVHREIDNAVTPGATAPAQPTLGQIVALLLKRPSARYTLATTVALAALAALALIHPTSSAWAMEQTVEALKKYKGLLMTGYVTTGDGKTVPLDLWARADVTGNWVEAVLAKAGDAGTVWTKNNNTYTYDQGGKTVYAEPGITVDLNPWPGPALLTLLTTVTDYKALEGEDPATGRKRVVVTCSFESSAGPQSYLMEFDVRTKLLVSMKIWQNSRQEGTPHCDFQKILYFENLPESVFNFHPPPDTAVTNMPLTLPDAAVSLPALNDPNYGISAEGMTREQACQKILEQYLEAYIKNDLARIRKLCPVNATLSDDFLRENRKLDGIAQVLKIGGIERTGSSKLGPLALVPSWDRDQDGTVSETWWIVQFRETDRGSSCVIYGAHGYALNAKE
jgi:hypothetical protein